MAFCFDEACLYIQDMLEETDKDGKSVNIPKWIDEKEKKNNSEVIKWFQGH